MSKASNVFRELLQIPAKKAVILDGGFGTELERIGKDYAQVALPSPVIGSFAIERSMWFRLHSLGTRKREMRVICHRLPAELRDK